MRFRFDGITAFILNPIEQLFAKLKALLRKVTARTRDELWSTWTANSSYRLWR